MDWTALTFGVLVAIIGTLFTSVALLVRRELDQARERHRDLEDRLRKLESDHRFLEPLAVAMERKAQEGAEQIASGRGA